MAIARPPADSGRAPGADRVQVALVKREVGSAELAGGSLSQAGSRTSGAPDHGRLVRVRLADFDDLATETMKPAATLPVRGIELTLAGNAGDEVAKWGWFSHDGPEYDRRPVAFQL